MHVYEIIAEKYYPIEEDRIDEVVPIIAGISAAGILSAVGILMAAWSFADIIKFIGKYNEDPSKISEEEWNDLFIDVLLLAIPGVAKLGKPMVVKLMRKNAFTRKMLAKGGKWLNTKVSDLWNKKKPAKFNQDYRAKIKQAKIDYPKSELAKNLAKAKFRAGEQLKSIGSAFNWITSIGGSVYYIEDYYTQEGLLTQEWEAWKASVKNNTPLKMPNRFADMSYSEAESKYDSERNSMLGKATIGIITSTGFAPAFLKWTTGKAASGGLIAMKTGTFTGAVGGGAVAASMGVLNAGARLMGLIAGRTATGAVGRTALITWLETTKEGKDFQQSMIVQALFSVTGWFTDKVLAGLRLAYTGLQKLAAKFGIKIGDLPPSMQPGGGSQKPDKQLADKEKKEKKEKETGDRETGISFGGVGVTDSKGYLLNDPILLRHPSVQLAIRDAKDKGLPSPLQKIPLDPSKTYKDEVLYLVKGAAL